MTIGVRELKANLSKYLRRVQGGATITVTAHGRAIAMIASAAADRAWLRRMVSDGAAEWNGGKPSAPARPIRLRKGARPTSQLVLEDRR